MKGQYKVRTIKCRGCGKTINKRMPKGRKYCSLECFRNSDRPQAKTGKIIICEWCGKDIYKCKTFLKSKNHFCSLECANKFQGRNKIEYICKICSKKFYLSKSLTQNRKYPIKYCSIKCRNNDPNFDAGIKGNIAQQNKKGLNKLELEGRQILKEMGIEFEEQILMFEKFLVDVIIKDSKLIIQWDGEYWHNKPKRKKLDISQDAYMKKCGYNVLRITDNQIKNNIKEVYENIKAAI